MHTILLIYDDPYLLHRIFAIALKNAGYEVISALDERDAHKKADRHVIDLVITYHDLTHTDGISLTRRLRESPKYKSTPILILTTEVSDQMREDGHAADATGWLTKDLAIPLMVDTIKKAIC